MAICPSDDILVEFKPSPALPHHAHRPYSEQPHSFLHCNVFRASYRIIFYLTRITTTIVLTAFGERTYSRISLYGSRRFIYRNHNEK